VRGNRRIWDEKNMGKSGEEVNKKEKKGTPPPPLLLFSVVLFFRSFPSRAFGNKRLLRRLMWYENNNFNI